MKFEFQLDNIHDFDTIAYENEVEYETNTNGSDIIVFKKRKLEVIESDTDNKTDSVEDFDDKYINVTGNENFLEEINFSVVSKIFGPQVCLSITKTTAVL